MSLDYLLASAIVFGAAVYLYRKFSKTRKSGSCGCSSSGGCCGGQAHKIDAGSCASKH